MNDENGCTCSGKPKLWWIERYQEFFFMRDGRPTPDLAAIVKEAERMTVEKLGVDKTLLENMRSIIDEFLKAKAPGCQDYARLNETAIEVSRRLKEYEKNLV